MRSPVRTTFATDDPDLAHDHITRSWGSHQLRLGAPGTSFGYRHDRVDLGAVLLEHVHHGAPAGYTLDPTGLLVVVRVRAGRVRATSAGVERRLHPGDVYLAARPDAELVTEFAAGTAVDVLSVGLGLLHEVDPAQAASRTARLRLQPLDPGAAAGWNRTAAHLRSVLDGTGAEVPGRLLLGAHGRLVAATLLELFDPAPGTPSPDRPDDRPDGRPASLRRVVGHIEAHPDLDLTPADLAVVAGVGVRALQLAFRKHLGTTPLAYLRRVRLDQVHADLLAADPARDTVARIAGGWGFTDPSRFTAQYKQAYGLLPSRTLHT